MTAYVTKYSLTSGIIKFDNVEETGVATMIRVKHKGITHYFHGDDWHTEEFAAIEKAELMRKKKIASLNKQIAKIEKIEFKITAPK